jgi:hypothetical protein
MRTVIYSDFDMEPITVVEVPEFLMERIRKHDRVRLAVYTDLEPDLMDYTLDQYTTRMLTVDLWGEPIKRNGQKHYLIFAANDELALLLKNSYLPGQVGDVARREKSAYLMGFLKALEAFNQSGSAK